jgi:hypothetical protein
MEGQIPLFAGYAREMVTQSVYLGSRRDLKRIGRCDEHEIAAEKILHIWTFKFSKPGLNEGKITINRVFRQLQRAL